MAATTNSNHPHILLATDRDPQAQEHLTYATKLGNRLGARITLYHAIPPTSLVLNAPLADNRVVADQSIEEVQRSLKEAASTLVADRPIHVEVEEAADPKAAILAAADRLGADLIVLPTHGRTGISRAVIGSTAEQVVRRATKPVLLLTDHMLQHGELDLDAGGPMLIATDVSPASVAAHTPAVALARRLGQPVRLLSIVDDPVLPPFGGGAPVAPPPVDHKPAIDARTKRLREMVLMLDSHAPIEIEVQASVNVVDLVVRRAKEMHAPLLVMTTHGRRGIARMLQGSVAEQVVRRSTTPVLIMPIPK